MNIDIDLKITEAAIKEFKKAMSDSGDNASLVRVSVQGGGCSGYQYGFTFDENQADDDYLIEQEGVKVLVDAASMTYLTGAEIDYKKDLTSAQFIIKNPNATNTCGCGSSFAA